MRIVKLGLLSIISLFLLITVISVFIPSRIRISKAISIKTTNSAVMAEIRQPSNWRKWYPGLDSAKPFLVEGIEKGMLFDASGNAYLKITEDKKDEITAQFVTKKMRPVVNVWKTEHYTNGDSLTLQWYMDFHLRWYPWEKFASLLLEASYGTKMEQGLTNLKKTLEMEPHIK